MRIKKVLIANRGEIAIRIIRALRELKIKSAAVFSEADRSSLHVKYADEAYYLGAADPAASYLNIEKIIKVLEKSGADAVHPGYGFLSENPGFARRITGCGKIFIGPSAQAIEILGDKTRAREIMLENDIPVTTGGKASGDIKELKKTAREIGYPVIIKAVSGGGGRGMRKVLNEEEFEEKAEMAVKESKICFGSDLVFVEKYIQNARHIEVQVLGDDYGNIIHLGERDCSIQRRHQKLIEEAPSNAVSPELRGELGETAVKIAKAVNYKNAGTVEFLMDKNNNFYFMEMNTRLQVEHPVTELVTGVDIVKQQIKIAEGEKLSVKQEDIKIKGAAIECRINAEDASDNFIPVPGKIMNIIFPGGYNTRVDSYVYPGFMIPSNYDSLIAKVIVHGETRSEAITRMKRALKEFIISGVKSTVGFHLKVLDNKFFKAGEFDTGFLAEHYFDRGHSDKSKEIVAAAAAALIKYHFSLKSKLMSDSPQDYEKVDKWKLAQKIERVK